MEKRCKNTYKNVILTFLFYTTPQNTYVGACEELCLVREGKTAKDIKKSIIADAKVYLINVIENRLGEQLLNQSLPPEIKKEFKNYQKLSIEKTAPSKMQGRSSSLGDSAIWWAVEVSNL